MMEKKDKNNKMQIDFNENIVVFGEIESFEPFGLVLNGSSRVAKVKNAILDINQYYCEENNEWIFGFYNLENGERFASTSSAFKTDRKWVNRATKQLRIEECESDILEIEFQTEKAFGLYDEEIHFEQAISERRNHHFGKEVNCSTA